jgi:hypothetical protein
LKRKSHLWVAFLLANVQNNLLASTSAAKPAGTTTTFSELFNHLELYLLYWHDYELS